MPALIAYAHRVSDNRKQNFNRESYKKKAIVWELVNKYSAVMGIAIQEQVCLHGSKHLSGQQGLPNLSVWQLAM
jgi:hypothetical protein